MAAAREDMQAVGVRVENTENRVKWKTVIGCGDPWEGTSRKEKKKKKKQIRLIHSAFVVAFPQLYVAEYILPISIVHVWVFVCMVDF